MEPTRLTFHLGDRVRIKPNIRSPYAGQSGVISQIDDDEYLVRFSDGLVFRYDSEELEFVQ